MKIEVLFPEVCNLYGDLQNMNYLKKCLPEAEFINTSLGEEPAFVTGKIDFIYLGPMTEKTQEDLVVLQRNILSKVKNYVKKLSDLLFENKKACGVEINDGKEVHKSDLVICNSSLISTFRNMIDKKEVVLRVSPEQLDELLDPSNMLAAH